LRRFGRQGRAEQHAVADKIQGRIREIGKDLDMSLLIDPEVRREGQRLGVPGMAESDGSQGTIAHTISPVLKARYPSGHRAVAFALRR
jgi:hypothetical protein